MTSYPYAGDGRPYTGPSYGAMALLGVIAAAFFALFCASALWLAS